MPLLSGGVLVWKGVLFMVVQHKLSLPQPHGHGCRSCRAHRSHGKTAWDHPVRHCLNSQGHYKLGAKAPRTQNNSLSEESAEGFSHH